MIDALKSIEPIGFLSFAPASAGTNRADVYRRIIQNRPYGRGGSASAACRPVWFRLRRLRSLRQAGGLPSHHLPSPAFVGIDIGISYAERVGSAAGHDANAARSGQDDRIAKVLRLDIGRFDCGVD